MSLGQASGLLGTKEKIQQSFRIKEEADKALEKLPDDASTHFLLGKWCLGVCNLGCASPPSPQPPAAGAASRAAALPALSAGPSLAVRDRLLLTRAWGHAGVERKAASAFFATPPESSYEEALGYMLNAAKHRDDWIRAAQQVGECYAKLNVRPNQPHRFSSE